MPFLKYPGGKRHQAALIGKLFADSGKRVYAEPFCGSAVVAEGIEAERYKLSDANAALVSTLFMAIQSPDLLIEGCEWAWGEFKGEEGYYRARDKFNSLSHGLFNVETPPLYIYLNKHGYNGLSRYSATGKFNVPWGKRTAEIPAENIRAFSAALPYANVAAEDYTVSLMAADEDWFIYADPPYLDMFAGYSPVKFLREDHGRLNALARMAAQRGAVVVISSGRASDIFDVYRDASSAIMLEAARSQIGQTPGSRGAMPEVLFVYKKR